MDTWKEDLKAISELAEYKLVRFIKEEIVGPMSWLMCKQPQEFTFRDEVEWQTTLIFEKAIDKIFNIKREE